MKQIKLFYLEMENFKCFQHLRLDFNGRNAGIFGDNATGKTTVYDGLMWLLFSKNSRGDGDKNFEVKPLSGTGAVADHSAITSVEVELDVDGERISLKRTYREKWETKRGSNEECYTGNTSEFYVCGVPVKRHAFQEKVDAIIDEDTFRLLTSVSFFAKDMSWQNRREVLFNMAGTVDDRDIMASAPQFAPLLEGMGKLSLDDFKKKLLSEKRGFANAKTDIPARISECERTVEDLSDLDFAGVKAETELLNDKQAAISKQIISIENDSMVQNKQLEIREAKVELDKLTAENSAFRATQMTSVPDVNGLRNTLVHQKGSLANTKSLLYAAEQSISSYEKLIEESRDRWIAVNGEVFTGGTCPTCAQQLPMEQLRQATEAFEKSKQARLREIERTAESQKSYLHQTQTRIQNLQEEVLALEEQIRQTENQIQTVETAVIAPVDMDGFAEKKAELDSKIAMRNAELQTLTQNSYAEKERLRRELADVNAKIKLNMAVCGKESALTYARNRITELREEARNAAACLEAIEKMLYLMDEYIRYKTRVVEDGVNSLFRIARFRLFREQANGGVEDRCDVMVDGVPYGNLNNGMKINVGIDIINALSRHYGVTVPLFVDNAESVTQLERADTQVIRLVVSADDKELRCVYENP